MPRFDVFKVSELRIDTAVGTAKSRSWPRRAAEAERTADPHLAPEDAAGVIGGAGEWDAPPLSTTGRALRQGGIREPVPEP